ncbi:MAG: metallophosphoesterase family protein [Chloroflexi bacterium]|nr:MAG: metallophosphoesterase family protein [Chloroflexota bacterium]TMD63476.1 MAG: metallophosphoesterase family protein [Chloroflexota bacterium]
MKIGLIADTQGKFDVAALLAHVAREFDGVDEIWHAGDWGDEEILTGLSRLGRIVVVNGNAPNDPRYPTTIEGTIGRWRVGMVHNLDKRRARWAAGYDVVIHGHTHRWRDEVVGRTRFINPGSATRPQFGGTERTMARLTFGNELQVEKLMVPKFARTLAI